MEDIASGFLYVQIVAFRGAKHVVMAVFIEAGHFAAEPYPADESAVRSDVIEHSLSRNPYTSVGGRIHITHPYRLKLADIDGLYAVVLLV